MNVSQMPMTHGMEIEQFPSDSNTGSTRVRNSDVFSDGMPGRVVRETNFNNWHRDGSGPQECDFGPYKQCKAMLNNFVSETEDLVWNWHSADARGNGAGSHVHFHLEEMEDDQTTKEAWAISWNSLVDTAPFFAPFFCHDWENGFRGGSSDINYWASAQTQRRSPSTMGDYLGRRGRESYMSSGSVIMNGSSGNKPATIEFRMSDAHPAFAMVGSQYVRKMVKDCLDREWSVKLDQENGISLNDLYTQVYNVPRGGSLISQMKTDLSEPIKFVEGRGLPGVKKLEFDSMWDVLMKIISQYLPWKGRWDRRVVELVRYAGEWTEEGLSGRMPCPKNNNECLWKVTKDEFRWDNGPLPEAHD